MDWLVSNWKEIVIGLLFADKFINNLAARMPSLKGCTWFECLANGLNALVATIKGNSAEPEDKEDGK